MNGEIYYISEKFILLSVLNFDKLSLNTKFEFKIQVGLFWAQIFSFIRRLSHDDCEFIQSMTDSMDAAWNEQLF